MQNGAWGHELFFTTTVLLSSYWLSIASATCNSRPIVMSSLSVHALPSNLLQTQIPKLDPYSMTQISFGVFVCGTRASRAA